MRIHSNAHQLIIKTKLLIVLLIVLLSATGSVIVRQASPAEALSGSQFNPSNIIADSVFYNSSSMSATQIQTFLNSKVPVCDTNGSQEGRAAYGTSRGYPPPYTCLKDYRQNTTSIAPESGLCSGYTGRTNESAATIISRVAQSCGINPQTLLVMLQKEQSLVTDDWPWSIQYQKAMGAFCPDTAPCDPGYAGFFKQMYYGAHRLKVYAANPTSFNYRAGRNNTIYYHPDLQRCGSSNVYIQNQATASLYIYTPYRPNQAALNNLYGEGDSCSSYGNRNFWRLFNDWFGSTVGSYLLRSTASATVYLVTDDNKYPISDHATLSALYPMGQVQYVSQSFLNGLSTGPAMKRLIKGSGSTIYFYDAGIKLPFTSCTMVAHYGMDCGDYAQLTDSQINAFTTGPNMPLVMNTTSGKWFYMQNGQKREAANQAALTSNAISTTNVRLNESSLASLPLGVPLTTTNKLIATRGTSTKSFVSGSSRYELPSGLSNLNFLTAMSGGVLDQASMNKLSTVSFNGYITDGSAHYILDNSGKVAMSNPSDFSSTFTTLTPGLVSAIPNSSQNTSANTFTKSEASSTVYRVTNRQKAPVQSWGDLLLINATPTITTMPAHYVSPLATIRPQFGPTRLVKTSSSKAVYMIDGLTQKKPVASYALLTAAGVNTNTTTVSQSTLDSYTTTSGFDHRLLCGSTYYLSTKGKLQSMSEPMRQSYGFANNSFISMQTNTCNVLTKSGTFSARYIKATNSPTVYYVESGTKKPFGSYNSFVGHGGLSSSVVTMEVSLIALIPTGTSL